MSTAQIRKEQQSSLQDTLWDIANDLRGNMDASEFKNYLPICLALVCCCIEKSLSHNRTPFLCFGLSPLDDFIIRPGGFFVNKILFILNRNFIHITEILCNSHT